MFPNIEDSQWKMIRLLSMPVTIMSTTLEKSTGPVNLSKVFHGYGFWGYGF